MPYRQRLILLFGFISLFCFVVVPARLFELQILRGNDYRERAEDRRVRKDPTDAPRGKIMDRNGLVLAFDEAVYELQVVFREIQDREWLVDQLAAIFGESRAELAAELEEIESGLVDKALEEARRAKAGNRRKAGNLKFRWVEQVAFPQPLNFKPSQGLPAGVTLERRFGRKWIFFRQPLEEYELWIDFLAVSEEDRLVETASAALALDAAKLADGLARARQKMRARLLRSSHSHTLRENLTLRQVIQIAAREAELPGLQIRIHSLRRFPEKTLLGQTLGSVGRPTEGQLRAWLADAENPEIRAWAQSGSPPRSRATFYAALHQELARLKLMPDDLVGRSGIEAALEGCLRGQRGEQLIERDARNRVQNVLGELSSRPGHSVYLTIDARLQRIVEQEFDRSAGAAIFMDVQTGEILAAASFPLFDPNELVPPVSEEKARRLFQSPSPTLNRVTSSYYPLGSIFKLLTSISVLEEGVMTPGAAVTCRGPLDPSQPNAFRCWNRHGHGDIPLHDAIQRSCNVFFYTCADRTPVAALVKWGQEFEFGVRPGSELRMFESSGLMPSPSWKKERLEESWYAGDSRNLAIGQGHLLVNPLQVVRMVATLANGGNLVPARFVRKVIAEDGEFVDHRKKMPLRAARRLPLSTNTLEILRRSMIDVVHSPAGTAHAALRGSSLPYRIAGKTSTAQTGTAEGNVGWFAGYAPADKPEFAFAIVVEGLRHSAQGAGIEEHGGDVAAPILLRILERYESSVRRLIAGPL